MKAPCSPGWVGPRRGEGPGTQSILQRGDFRGRGPGAMEGAAVCGRSA